MTSPTNDGGPAFPTGTHTTVKCPETGNVQENYTKIAGGLSIRDYFAARAMQAIISDETLSGTLCSTETDYGNKALQNQYSTIAIDAYYMADFMLKARAK